MCYDTDVEPVTTERDAPTTCPNTGQDSVRIAPSSGQDAVFHFRVTADSRLEPDQPKPKTIDPAEIGMRPSPDGQVWIDDRFGNLWTDPRFESFDTVMRAEDDICQRVLKDRENWILEQIAGPHGPRRAFLKKHHVRSLASRLRAKFGGEPVETAGRIEARFAKQLEAQGIACLQVMAWGERLRSDGTVESFFLSDELRDYAPLDDFLKERFAASHVADCPGRDRDFDRLMRGVADLARRFHAAGYNHRDLYCCHFYVKEMQPGSFDIRLIDLQRVQHRRLRRGRWIVKDLAQLAYSAPPSRVSRTRRLAFMRHYLGVRKLRRRDKRLIRRVLAKRQRMQWKLGPVE